MSGFALNTGRCRHRLLGWLAMLATFGCADLPDADVVDSQPEQTELIAPEIERQCNNAEECDDGNPCTNDSCLSAGHCVNEFFAGKACDDGNPCTANDFCDEAAFCIGGEALNCDDKNPCTEDGCNPATGCISSPVPDGMGCDDDLPCTGDGICTGGICSSGPPIACEDPQPTDCLAPACKPATGTCDAVTFVEKGGSCDDANPCTKDDTCDDTGVCQGSAPFDCIPLDQCHMTWCDEAAGSDEDPCQDDWLAQGTECDDLNSCTEMDVCQLLEDGNQTICAGGEVDCDDGLACTIDNCENGVGCLHSPADDGTPCAQPEYQCFQEGICSSGSCVPIGPACDDGITCTVDICSIGGECLYVADSSLCDDGLFCTGTEVCTGEDGCAALPLESLDDKEACTLDLCNEEEDLVEHLPLEGACDDGNTCTLDDWCNNGLCTGGAATLDCDDANPCTLDSCLPALGCVHDWADGSCDDGNPCTDGDKCSQGVCQPESAVECDDGNPCTQDSCDEEFGCIATPLSAEPCADSSPCANGSECDAGKCLAVAYATGCEIQCGDGSCQPPDNPSLCPVDCGACGDGACRELEARAHGAACARDCLANCGDGMCVSPENSSWCLLDCGNCGDGLCSLSEDHNSCATDCPSSCGDSECSGEEEMSICLADCLGKCGDGICDWTETPFSCSQDCTHCGDGHCTTGESLDECPEDCSNQCGNQLCEGFENADSCAADCGDCGDGVCGATEDGAGCPQDCDGGCGDGQCGPLELEDTCPTDCALDPDGDWVLTILDNCPLHFNPAQADLDGDGVGDLCDFDDDGDGENDATDCEPADPQVAHSVPDVCDGIDSNCDGVPDELNGLCDDGIACTLDECAGNSGCSHIPTHSSCDDGIFCNGEELCLPPAGCQTGPGPNVDDGIGCTVDTCDPITDAAVNTPEPSKCTDGNDCTEDVCLVETGCTHLPLPEGSPCGSAGTGTCASGECKCVPDCEAKDCGDDGCGGNCGSCSEAMACLDNECVYVGGCLAEECAGSECKPELTLSLVDLWYPLSSAGIRVEFKISTQQETLVGLVDEACFLAINDASGVAFPDWPGKQTLIEETSDGTYVMAVCSPLEGPERSLTVRVFHEQKYGNLVVSYDATGFDLTPCDSAFVLDPCGTTGHACGEIAGVPCPDCPCGKDCIDGSCIYTACEGYECGDDGCGNSCGLCDDPLVCVTGSCQLPYELACDGLDEDEDGIVDEDFALNDVPIGSPCSGDGECGPGTVECTPDGTQAMCSTMPAGTQDQSLPEDCDGLDNNCDGLIDNDLPAPPGKCMLNGVCKGTMEDCEGLAGWVCNYPELYEEDEVACDGLNNDCDLDTDEGFDLEFDEDNCGGCGTACDLSQLHAVGLCLAGKCTVGGCLEGWFNTDGSDDNGCEESIESPGTFWVDAANDSGVEDGSAAKPFSTIGAAIANAAGKELILVKPAEYAENLLVDIPYLSIRGVGAEAGEVKITGSAGTTVVTMAADHVALDNVQISGGSTGVMLNEVNGCRIRGVILTQLAGSNGQYAKNGEPSKAIWLQGGGGHLLSGIEVEGVSGGNGGSLSSTAKTTNGPDGGPAFGFYLEGTTGNTLRYTRVKELSGGNATQGGYQACGGAGGAVTAFHILASQDNLFEANLAEIAKGGVASGPCGGGGGAGTGFFIEDSEGNTLLKNAVAVHGDPGQKAQVVGFHLEGDSWQNTIPETNTVDNDEVLYFYDQHDVELAGYSLKATSSPTNLGKLALVNCTGFVVTDNEFRYFTGVTGSTGGYNVAGTDGSSGAGVLLQGGGSHTITDNKISDISGGTGGNSNWTATAGSGGKTAGIVLVKTQNNVISGNLISDITGGKVGAGGGGMSGSGAGLFLSGSTGNTVSDNEILETHDGSDGVRGYGLYIEPDSHANDVHTDNTFEDEPIVFIHGKDGGEISGYELTAEVNPTNYGKLALVDCTNVTVTGNTLRNYLGKAPVTGEDLLDDKIEGNGVGLYLSGGSQNVVTGNTISDISGAASTGLGVALWMLDGTDNQITDNQISSIAGGLGQGCFVRGGPAMGLWLTRGSGNQVQSNKIANLSGGKGSNSNAVWCNGYQTGGVGGRGTGILLDQTTDNLILANSLSEIAGGAQGVSDGAGAPPVGGRGMGIQLIGAPGNQLKNNTLTGISGDTGAYCVHLAEDSYPNTVESTNQCEADPILYEYGKTGGEISGFATSADTLPTNLGKLVLINCTDVQVTNNVLANAVGSRAENGSYNKSGKDGAPISAIYVSGGSGIQLVGNTVSDVSGGQGGVGGQQWGTSDTRGGHGGAGYGIRALDCPGLRVYGNSLDSVAGGSGGGTASHGGGGNGGDGLAVHVDGCPGAEVGGNAIVTVEGGKGGAAQSNFTSGAGGAAYGVESQAGSVVKMVGNVIAGVAGGKPGSTKYSAKPGPQGTGKAILLHADLPQSASLASNTINSVEGADACGVHFSSLAKGTIGDNIVADVTGGPCISNHSDNDPADVTVSYSLFHGCEGGALINATETPVTCIHDQDPLFVDAEDGDLHLLPDSPAIDTGDPNTDYSNEPSPNGCRINMGAYGNTDKATSAPGAQHCQ